LSWEKQLVLSLLEEGVMPIAAIPTTKKDKVIGFRCSADAICQLLDVPDNKGRSFMTVAGKTLIALGARKVKTGGFSKWDFPALQAMRDAWDKQFSRHDWVKESKRSIEWRKKGEEFDRKAGSNVDSKTKTPRKNKG
jgi:hypothetical protein